MNHTGRFQKGTSMIEVLVSLTIVAFGLLGLAGLQARSMSFQKDSFDRKAAAEMAAQLAERVRANYDGYRAGNYDGKMLVADPTPGAVPQCFDPLNCTTQEVANRDWAMWQIDLRRRLPTSGAYLVAPANARQMTITLAWQEGQKTTDVGVDPNCTVVLPGPPPAPAANDPNVLNDPRSRCFTWILHP